MADWDSNDYSGQDFYSDDAVGGFGEGQVYGESDESISNWINQQGSNDLSNTLQQQGFGGEQYDNMSSGLTSTGQGYDFSGGNQFQLSDMPQGYQQGIASGEWGNQGGSIQNALKDIFAQMGTKEGKGALTGLGALVEGMQNKKKSAMSQQLIGQQQQRLDPFGSQRGYYQQQLQNTVQNPYGQAIVKDQVAQIARAQAIKDAAAGRRSNSATSSPAMLAAQAQIAQQYMNSLMQPAGAGISPNAAGLSELLQGVNAGVNGYASPILSALGYKAQSGMNQGNMNTSAADIAAIKAKLGIQ